MCEMCGADVARTKTVVVEGTVLSVCPSCARFGEEVNAPQTRRRAAPPVVAERLEARRRRMTPRDVFSGQDEEDLAPDYGDRIRRAREARGWRQADLGAKINERATIIAKVESGAMVPSENLLRRLERTLGITLTEKVPEPVARRASRAREAPTLGDLLGEDE